MAALGEATVEVRASLGKLDGDLSKAKGAISGALGGLEKGLQGVGNLALGGVVAGFTALAAGIGVALNEAMGAQAIMAQTEAVIKSTGGAAGMSAKQIGDLATALSTQSRFSDDAIQTGENLLLTFTNIGKDVFPQATQAMVDMAAAMGTDVSGGAIQLGKALNDPVAGISALTRVGVTFTDEQKKVIKALVATGDVAGAQAVILAELNKEFGGSAAAAAETFAGKLDVVKNKLLNVAEGIGLQLLPVLAVLLDGLSAKALPVINAVAASFGVFFDRMSAGFPIGTALGALVAEIATAFGMSSEQANALAAGVSGVVDWFGTLAGKVGEVVAAITPYLTMAAEWLAGTFSLQDVLITLGIAIASVVIPAILAVAPAVAGAIIAFAVVMAVVALLRKAWESDFGGIQEKTAAVIAWLTTAIPAALTSIQAWWAANGDAILAKAAATYEAIRAAVSAALSAAMAFVQSTLASIQSFWAANGESILATVQSNLAALLATITGALAGIQAFWQAHGDSIITIVRFVWDLVAAITTIAIGIVVAALAGLQIFWAAWGDTIVKVVSNMGESLGFVIDAIAAIIKGDWTGLGTALGEIWNNAWENIGLILSNAHTVLGNIMKALVASITGAFSSVDWGGIGKSMIDGIVAGLKNAAGFLLTAAQNAAKAAYDAAYKAISGGSPSRLFMNIGESMMQGMAIGIMRNAGLAAAAMSGALMPVVGLVGADGGGDRSVHYSSVTNVTTNRDPLRVLRASRHLDKLGSLS